MDNAKGISLENTSINSVSEDNADPRATLIEDFLTQAKNLDKDQNKVIDQQDIDWFSRLDEYTDERKRTYEKLMRHAHTIDPECGEPKQVSVDAIDTLRASVRGRLSRASENRNATAEATKHFDDIDIDKDGYLTEKEAHQAYRSGKISAETSQFIEKNDEQLQVLNNDEWGYENNGISADDLSIASQRNTSKDTVFVESLGDELRGVPDLLFELEENWFDYLDLNDDKVLSRIELKFHTKDSNSRLSEHHKELVKLLEEHDALFKYTDPVESDTEPLLAERDLIRLAQTAEGLHDDQARQLGDYRYSEEYEDALGNWTWGIGAPAGFAGAMVGAGTAGVLTVGNPFAVDALGVVGGGVGFCAGAAVGSQIGESRMEAHFHRGYEQNRQPALESFVEKYRFLRNDYLTKNGPTR